jgi:16S rRNA (guanine527-N7)-methyltransferase
MGLDVPAETIQGLAAHLSAVIAATKEFNLTRVPEQEAVALHVLDSATAYWAVDAAPEGPMVDLGSGAGFPGIPLAVLTRRHTSLVESVRKKAAFLERVVADLCLDVVVHPVRAEELALSSRDEYSVATARALSALPSLVELAAPLLAVGGRLICMKAAPNSDELSSGRKAARLCGLVELEQVAVAIPGNDSRRSLIIYEKAGPSATRLPRRAGMAQRQPLA